VVRHSEAQIQVFGRRSTSESEAADETPKVGGKGHATPTRKEAEAARKQRLTAPQGRKEQSARTKEARRAGRSLQQQALAGTGDDRYLPARDQGPVKRYIRDYVDSRRTMGEFLLPVFFGVFILLLIGQGRYSALGSYAWLAIIVLMLGDSIRVVRGVKAEVRTKFGEDDTKGVAMYAVMRAWQMRRLRLPKPLVKAGDKI
jgi:hypothetical protein